MKRHNLLVWFGVALIALTVSACTASASTANISDAKMAHDKEGKNPTRVFSPDEPFYLVADLSNAPDDTRVKAVWTAVAVEGAPPNTKIDQASVTHGSGQLRFNLTNDKPWPVGKYEVDLLLNDKHNPARTLKFEVRR